MAMVLTWTSATGTVIAFNAHGGIGYTMIRGALGLDAPPTQNTVDPYITFDGSALISRRRNARSVALPLLIKHATRAQTLVSALASALAAGGTLQYADGTVTYTLRNVIYDGGMQGDQREVASPLWRKVVIDLLALDPWWYGASTSTTIGTGGTTAFSAAISFDAAVPFDGGNTTSVSITGDAEAYPVITAVGPYTTLTVGDAFGLSWSIAAALSASDTLIVDHRPGSRGPRLNGGAVDWSLLTAASRLWTLPAGSTSVVGSASGTTGASSVSMAWEPRHLTP